MKNTIYIIIVIVFFLAVIFGVKNTQDIALSYFYDLKTPSFPLYYLIFIPFIIGVAVGSLFGFAARLRLKNTVKKLYKSNRELEEKLKQAREAQISREYETPVLEEKSTDTEVIHTT